MQVSIEFLELSKKGREILFDFLKSEIEEKKYPVKVSKGELTPRKWIRLKEKFREELKKFLKEIFNKEVKTPEIVTSKPIIPLTISFKEKKGKVYILPLLLRVGDEELIDLLMISDEFKEENLRELQFVINLIGLFFKFVSKQL